MARRKPSIREKNCESVWSTKMREAEDVLESYGKPRDAWKSLLPLDTNSAVLAEYPFDRTKRHFSLDSTGFSERFSKRYRNELRSKTADELTDQDRKLLSVLERESVALKWAEVAAIIHSARESDDPMHSFILGITLRVVEWHISLPEFERKRERAWLLRRSRKQAKDGFNELLWRLKQKYPDLENKEIMKKLRANPGLLSEFTSEKPQIPIRGIRWTGTDFDYFDEGEKKSKSPRAIETTLSRFKTKTDPR